MAVQSSLWKMGRNYVLFLSWQAPQGVNDFPFVEAWLMLERVPWWNICVCKTSVCLCLLLWEALETDFFLQVVEGGLKDCSLHMIGSFIPLLPVVNRFERFLYYFFKNPAKHVFSGARVGWKKYSVCFWVCTHMCQGKQSLSQITFSSLRNYSETVA